MQNSRCPTDHAYSDELATVHIRLIKAIGAGVDEKAPAQYDELGPQHFSCDDARKRPDGLYAASELPGSVAAALRTVTAPIPRCDLDRRRQHVSGHRRGMGDEEPRRKSAGI